MHFGFILFNSFVKTYYSHSIVSDAFTLFQIVELNIHSKNYESRKTKTIYLKLRQLNLVATVH
jgi:hypothetical protein